MHVKTANEIDLPQKSVITEGKIRTGPLIAIPQLLREQGIDPEGVMSEAGLDLILFDDPENVVSFVSAGRLLKVCAERSGCPHFGLLAGQRVGLSSLGLIGLLAQHSSTVGAALRGLVLYLHVHERGAVPALTVDHGLAVVSYSIYQQGVGGTAQIQDMAMAITCNILRGLCGPAWRPTEVLFSHRPPEHLGPHRQFFQVPLRFDMEQTAVVFPAHWLERPVIDADPWVRRIVEQHIAALENMSQHDLVSQIRRVLRVLLLTHSGSARQVAAFFSLHPRTLNRRLQAQGTTFQKLVDEGRYAIARHLLENTRMSMGQISAVLDYSDASAFTRAFRRWAGVAPMTWRLERS
jgi:AraC-like DNA-binding protein